MNFIEHQTPQKLRGGFYTEPDIARFLARWILEIEPKSVLEPSCGDGAFVAALLAERPGRPCRIDGWELDPAEAAKARERALHESDSSVQIHTGDFLKWFVFEGSQAGRFDGVVGNPPFIRYQYLGEPQQFFAEKIFSRFGLPFTRHTNAWVPFVIASLHLLAPGGRLGMVIPSEILHIRHADSLRRFLALHCARVLVLDPEELWFEDAQQGVVLLLAEKKRSPEDVCQGVAVQVVRDRELLQQPPAQALHSAEFVNGHSIAGKWMPLLLASKERSLLDGVRASLRFARFDQLAEVDVGIVTGANKFFLVSDDVVKTHGLQPWAHPMFGRSEHVAGLVFDGADHEANRQAGLPANFLWFDAAEAGTFPPEVQRYLRAGEDEGLAGRFKCRVRQPWYRVPSVYASPVAMLKRAHHFPRLVLNRAGAFTTDTAYRIKPKQGTAASLVYSFFNSLTCLCAELEGRHYGGGVLELVPSEIERLCLPLCTASDAELVDLDARFRSTTPQESLLKAQDDLLLQNAGLSGADRQAIQNAWDRLRRRRQRTVTATADADGDCHG